jgi:aromatic-L-amino-acid decarboxylase
MPPEEFRRFAHEAADWISEYLATLEHRPVFPDMRPGDLEGALPGHAPEHGEPMERVLEDFRELVVPALTHWNHPAFFGYYSITASGPGILGELLAAALNVNAMVWRSAPAATELEDVTMDWLRILLGLPDGFEGVINDTASSSSLYALAAAREVAYPEAHASGLFGSAPGRIYASDQAHSSIEKAVLTLGLGQDGYRAVASDAEFRMDVDALRQAMEEDMAAGVKPVAIVATAGTTSSASIDPTTAIADVAEEFGAWLHVDAAYGGPASIVPECRSLLAGWERADSIVVNPHKWLFTPIDCSALYCRRPETLVRAFSIVPEYLTSREQSEARSLMDYGVSLGRRFRALKLWFVLRYFGREGIVERIREHMRLARVLEASVRASESWVVVAPVHLGLVTLRYAPSGIGVEDLDAMNLRIMERVNQSGGAFLTHTALDGRTVLRVAIGNLKTREEHVERVWRLLEEAARAEHPRVADFE